MIEEKDATTTTTTTVCSTQQEELKFCGGNKKKARASQVEEETIKVEPELVLESGGRSTQDKGKLFIYCFIVAAGSILRAGSGKRANPLS